MRSQGSETVDQASSAIAQDPGASGTVEIQPAGFLVVMSLDWIVLRASENIYDFLGESHVTLIEEPLSRFVQAQALHDLRNHFSRLSGSTGVARAYRVRLTDDRPRFDIAFQVSDGRVLLDAVPSPERGLGEAIGSVGGLVESLAGDSGEALLEGAARRVRALTGCDRCWIQYKDGTSERTAESARASAPPSGIDVGDLPPIVADTGVAPVPIFPRKVGLQTASRSLLRSPPETSLQRLRECGIGSVMTVPLSAAGKPAGVIQCESHSSRKPNLELHAAVELFAQMLALRLEVDRLRNA